MCAGYGGTAPFPSLELLSVAGAMPSSLRLGPGGCGARNAAHPPFRSPFWWPISVQPGPPDGSQPRCADGGSSMMAEVLSAVLVGVECVPVRVEVSVTSGLPSISVVGLAQGAVRESKERVRAALLQAGYRLPPRRITVNLSPADVKKEGSGFDLPLALGLLAGAEHIPRESPSPTAPSSGRSASMASFDRSVACLQSRRLVSERVSDVSSSPSATHSKRQQVGAVSRFWEQGPSTRS